MLCSVLRTLKVFFVGNAIFSSHAILHIDSNRDTVAVTYHLEHDMLRLNHTVTLIQNEKYHECFEDNLHAVDNQYLYLSPELKQKLKQVNQVSSLHKSQRPCPSCPLCQWCGPCPSYVPILLPENKKNLMTNDDQPSNGNSGIVSESKNHGNPDKKPTVLPTREIPLMMSGSTIKKNETLTSNRTVLPSSSPAVFRPIPTTSNISNQPTIVELHHDTKQEGRRPISKSIRPIYLISKSQQQQQQQSDKTNVQSVIYTAGQQHVTDTSNLLHGGNVSISHSDRVSNVIHFVENQNKYRKDDNIKVNQDDDESDSDSDSEGELE